MTSGKVPEGYLKAASIGLAWHSDDRDIGRKCVCVYISNMKAGQHHLRTTACGLGFGFQAGSKEQCGQAAGSLKPHAMIACEKHRMKHLADIAIRRRRPSARLQPDINRDRPKLGRLDSVEAW